ncbi:hypothetical protein PUMCH_000205 [Australozyma saopauloensis]|uniref:Golgi to ER traffic protein 4 n=1 Tax=Australozyma saopauloensis TaxID=291208 RepID=A0AAX4H370_9ASCO|nr:hypothetical protein PUMCH_000205 [[Candida] saopauloensis]
MSDKISKTIQRFQQRVDNKEFYEAHQTIRTIVNRYVRATQYTPALQLLAEGSAILANNKEYASATDLILYMINVLEEAGITSSDKDYKMKLIELISLLPDTDPALGDLAKASISWSKKLDALTFGDASLHHLFGCKLINAVASQTLEENKYKMFTVAELHLILGTFESLPIYVDYLFQWYQENKDKADPGKFLARAVYNYAYLKNNKFMNTSIELFLKKLSALNDNSSAESLSLVVFLQLLATTLGKADAGDKFMKLFNHYKSQLEENELVAPTEYLGNLYFQLRLGNPNAGNNMLANLMGGLFK